MDVRSKINFINSVAGGQKIPCPKCSTLNETDAKFCITCGTPLEQKKAADAAGAAADAAGAVVCKGCGTVNDPGSKFCVSCGTPLEHTERNDQAPVSTPPAPLPIRRKVMPAAPVQEPVKAPPVIEPEETAEEASIFAEGLPAWDIVPPQVMVRRKRR